MAVGSQVQSRILDSVEAQQELIKDNTKTMERLGQLIGTNLNTTNNLLKDVIEGLRS